MRTLSAAAKSARRSIRGTLAVTVTALLTFTGISLTAASAHAAPELNSGDTVYIGTRHNESNETGAEFFPIYSSKAAMDDGAAPLLWTYCIEHSVGVQSSSDAFIANFDEFLGSNNFKDSPIIQGRVLWLLNNGYPALSLPDFATAAGVDSISLHDATLAMQSAIWDQTDNPDPGTWTGWSSFASANDPSTTLGVYLWLQAGANAAPAYSPTEMPEITVGVTGPSEVSPGTVAGPFTIHTNQAAASVNAGYPIVDASGSPIDTSAILDGETIYLDLRAENASGDTTIVASAKGSNNTGMVINVPKAPDQEPTTENHAQSMILVADHTATTQSSHAVTWASQGGPTDQPSIRTTLVDSADNDHDLPWNGGTVIDTIAYQNLVPDTTYTVAGELMNKADGTGTGITASKTFTPTSASGSVALSFVVPEGYAGKSLVAFEWLYLGSIAGAEGSPVAQHTDLNDAAQTVAVAQKSSTTTPGSSDSTRGTLSNTGGPAPFFALGIAATLAIAGLLIPVLARRSRAE